MTKDYQEEVEEIINRLTVEFDTNNLWKSDDGDTAYVAIGNLWNSIRKEMTEALTTYGNARELEGVEKVEKGVPHKQQGVEEEIQRGGSVTKVDIEGEQCWNACRQATLDHIAKVKAELK
jgi:hypothetical protein